MGSDKPCVLVLEDSVLVAMAIEAALADRGFEAVVAGSLAAAHDRIGHIRLAAALLDLELPDGNSLELARALHARGCPVALCSGRDSAEIPPHAPFATIFRKPVESESLVAWVAAVVAGADGPGDR